MRKVISLLAALAVALAMVGTAAAQEATGTVTVIHGVPGATVDVYVNNDLTLEGFEFGTITDPLELPEGDYEVLITPAGEDVDNAIIEGSTTLPAGANATLIAHLAESGDPTLGVFVNDTSAISAGDARLTVRHTAAAPVVDILVDGDVAVEGLANPEEQTLTVPAAVYSVEVAPTGTTDAVLGPADVTLGAGTAYFVYAVGSAEDGTLDLLIQTISALGEAPTGIPAGDSGLLDESGLPVWAIALLGIGGALIIGSGLLLVRGRAQS